MSGDGAMEGFERVCVKLYAPDPGKAFDQTLVPIFHEWIRDGALADLVLLDVADYAHVPDSPGIMLVSHEAHFGLDRSDGRFGLLVQRRVSTGLAADEAIATTLRQALRVADRLEEDSRLADVLSFDRSQLRIEANDRLRAPNSDAGYDAFAPVVREGVSQALGDVKPAVTRVATDRRDRLAVAVRVSASQGVAHQA